MIVLFGQKQREVDYIVTTQKCPHCNHGNLEYSLQRGYFHVFYLPLFPLGKYAYVICSHCKWLEDTRSLLVKKPEHPQDVFSNDSLEQIRKSTRTPMWYWIGGILFTTLALIGIFAE